MPPKTRKEDDEKNELMRKNLCFTCREPWELGHRCMGRVKIHYIEAISNDEDLEPKPHSNYEEEDTNGGTSDFFSL